ncbi:MAG: S9 family peptidase [Lewinellaceae bacterium]|nr:S9 family peptidase [Lewinellaceae bacterium]
MTKYTRLLLSFLLGATTLATAQLQYPVTRTTNQVDEYFGKQVADPYRWLEDDNAPETMEWVQAQNAVTFGYLETIPHRPQWVAALEKVINYPRYSAPTLKGEWVYFYKNDGLQNQSVLYRQKGFDGAPEVVIDPNQLSTDGTTRLTVFNLSKDGRYAGYGLSKSGSDWQEYYVMDMATKQTLSDKLDWVKVSGLSWRADGFYYSRYPAPAGSEFSAKNENHQVWYHRVGTPQSADQLVYEDPANPQRFHFVSTDDDERFAFLSISDRGKGTQGNALLFMDLGRGDKAFRPIVAEPGEFVYRSVEVIGDDILVMTNEDAKNYKLRLFSTKTGAWKNFVEEKPEPLSSVSSGGGKLFLTYMKDVTSRVYSYDFAGKMEREIVLPGPGSAGGFGGEKKDKFVFYTFTSFNYPPTIFRYDIATRTSTVFRKPEVAFDPESVVVEQVFYPGKDGTRVPMFLVYKKGLPRNGQNPTMLYAYGGFNVSTNPGFNAMLLPFLEQGGVYASANIRGGSEYGEQWHEAGMRLKKQNVYDDFIAAAEYLIREKYTSKEKLAIRGGSNGGLLVGAVMNQRPDLCRVAFPQVGVMDMLRFHKFTIGWNWIPEYGSSEQSKEDFENLYGYSPLHNIRETAYPATMVTTADHDDRVVPAHSFKYAAALQAKNKGSYPALIRIETKSGHGASSTRKNIELMADIYAFMFQNMGLTPEF